MFVEEREQKFITDEPVVYIPTNIKFEHVNLNDLKITNCSPFYSMSRFLGPTQQITISGNYKRNSKYSNYIEEFPVEIRLNFSNNFWNPQILEEDSINLELTNKSNEYSSSIYIYKNKGLLRDDDRTEIMNIIKDSYIKMKIDSEYKVKKKNKFFSNIFNKFKKA